MENTDQLNCRVLIVADQKEIHRNFAEILQSRFIERKTNEVQAEFVIEEESTWQPQYVLLHASSGEEACEIIKAGKESNYPVSVAYVDVRMSPGIDGIETVRRVRKIDRDVQLVIMTTGTEQAMPGIIRKMGLLRRLLYIRIPSTREEIQQMTIYLVEKWKVERQLAEKPEQLNNSYRELKAALDAAEDPMAMWDVSARVVFANHGYEKLFDLSENALQKTSPEAFVARYEKRFRELNLTDEEGGSLFRDAGNMVEEINTAQGSGQRLFYRSIRPVIDGPGEVLGDLYVYRDVSKEIEVERMKTEVLHLRSELENTYSFANLVGTSDQMRRVYSLVKQAAESEVTVLIQGESGTGKELVAKSLHRNSLRKNGHFLAINCAAIPENLIESELFGHEQGAFTGAFRQRIGIFEYARGGTVLLDEIGDMPPVLQSKLLRVLQERMIRRVGGTSSIPIDIRVIVATNKNLELAMREGQFRDDLYYRIAVFPIVIPPLWERREDIPLLANHFLRKHAASIEKSINSLSTATLQLLLQYDWPGNVRELENAIERAVLLETTDTLQADNLPPQLLPLASRGEPPPPNTVRSLAEVERQALLHAFEVSAYNVIKASQSLGIDRATFYRKLKKYDLPAKH